MPLYPQQRYQTRTDPPADFAVLATDPLPVLDSILLAMEAYRADWKNARDAYKAQDALWEARHVEEFDADAAQFDDEIERFRRGRDLIRDNADVLLTFKLTNETFRRGPRTSWRLFQIVFLVSQLPGLTSLANIPASDPAEFDIADIIYFPTGGGKTEAYLAVLVFHWFFDRLRGKTAGVTAWIRFPLRLLTLQQTQRVADVICVADVVRREQTDPRLSERSVAGFSVGYFVGETSTPNELLNVDNYQYSPEPRHVESWAIAQDASERQRWRRLIKCPSCQTSTVQLDLDVNRVRIIHRCTNPGCERGCGAPDGVRAPAFSQPLVRKAGGIGVRTGAQQPIRIPDPKALSISIYPNNRFGATIGALTALFEQTLRQWVSGIRTAKNCVYDPICHDHGGNCHACTHLAETSCRFFNLNLSRAFLFGGPDNQLGEIQYGYFAVT